MTEPASKSCFIFTANNFLRTALIEQLCACGLEPGQIAGHGSPAAMADRLASGDPPPGLAVIDCDASGLTEAKLRSLVDTLLGTDGARSGLSPETHILLLRAEFGAAFDIAPTAETPNNRLRYLTEYSLHDLEDALRACLA
jgi:hypothetical protein